jgi:hypothetical protein
MDIEKEALASWDPCFDYIIFSDEKSIMMRTIVLYLCLAFFSHSTLLSQNDPHSNRLRIASCQFPVSSDIRENLRWIEEQTVYAKLRKADIIHFPECALSGYPGVDMETMDDFDWDLLKQASDSVLALAKKFECWIVITVCT